MATTRRDNKGGREKTKHKQNASFHLHKTGNDVTAFLSISGSHGIIATTPLLSLASKDRFALDTLHVQPDIPIQLHLQSL